MLTKKAGVAVLLSQETLTITLLQQKHRDIKQSMKGLVFMKRTALGLILISMFLMTLIILLVLPAIHFRFALAKYFEALPVEWNRTYGRGGASCAIQTADGGYAMVGGGGVIGEGVSMPGTVLVKTDASGELQWKKQYDPPYSPNFIIQTEDLGYLFSGYNEWLVKTDSEGNIRWSKRFDVGGLLLRTNDNGCVIAGCLRETHYGEVALLKIDENGDLLWNRTYGIDVSWIMSATETSDGGYALTGNFGGVWFAKIDSNGNLQFKRNYEVSFIGVNIDGRGGIAETADGGYVIIGSVTKSNRHVPWIIKIDSQGSRQWIRRYEVGAFFRSVVQLEDGGYLVAGDYLGLSSSTPLAFFVRTDAEGKLLWENFCGVNGINEAVLVVADGESFVVAGTLDRNIWLAKFGPESKISGLAYEALPIEWKKSYKDYYDVSAFIQTADGGYAIAGQNATPADRGYTGYVPLLIKTDSSGALEWKKRYSEGPSSFDLITQTEDYGYLLSGANWLVKMDAGGNVQWVKRFDGVSRITGIQKADGGFAFIGIVYGGYPDIADTLFVRTDEGGNQLWNTTLSSGSLGEDLKAYDLAKTVDKGYAMAGTLGNVFWFAKIDSNGNLQVNRTYSSLTSDGAHLSSISETSDGGFILAGTDGYNRHRAWLIKTDAQGNPLWSNYYGDLQIGGKFISVAQTSDGGYIAGGSALVKVDPSGKIMWTAPHSVSFLTVNRDGRIMIGYHEDQKIWLVQLVPEPNPMNYIAAVLILFAIVAVLGLGLLIYLIKR